MHLILISPCGQLNIMHIGLSGTEAIFKSISLCLGYLITMIKVSFLGPNFTMTTAVLEDQTRGSAPVVQKEGTVRLGWIFKKQKEAHCPGSAEHL